MAALQAASVPAPSWLGNLFGGNQQAAAKGPEGASLLEDWNSYAHGRDVETGGAPGSSTNPTSAAAQDVLAAAGTFLSNSLTTVSKGVTSGVAALPGALPTAETFSIPTAQQLTHFFAFLAGGGVLLLLAFMVFLPVIIIAPAKFALSYTLGCLMVFGAFFSLRGWQQQVAHMLTRERLPFSAAYISSVLATLYAALIMSSYLLCLLCSGLQVVALAYYVFSYFPGGTAGVKFMLNLFYQAVLSCLGGVQRAALK